MVVKPEYPIKVVLLDYEEEYILNNHSEICTQLEFFNSEDIEENATVKDFLNRDIILIVENLEIIEFKISKPEFVKNGLDFYTGYSSQTHNYMNKYQRGGQTLKRLQDIFGF